MHDVQARDGKWCGEISHVIDLIDCSAPGIVWILILANIEKSNFWLEILVVVK